MLDASQHAFADLLSGNEVYAYHHHRPTVSGAARRGLAVVTCIDSRIDPLAVLGLVPGDAKIIRNAGARATDDVLRSLVVAVAVLGVDRVAVVAHTDCKMAAATPEEVRAAVVARGGADPADEIDFLLIDDQRAALAGDVERIRRDPHIPPAVTVQGFVLDLENGRLEPVT